MYERILVPLDGSALAEVALPYAEELSGRLGSEVTLIFVSELVDDSYQRMRQLYLQNIVEVTKQAAETYLPKSGKKQKIQVKSVTFDGNPAEQIVEYADKENVGLIVMSTHGQSGITRESLGSIANKVVRATSRPVALIRAKGYHPDVRRNGTLTKLLLTLDGSKVGEAGIPYAVELASRLGAKVVLLRVLGMSYGTFSSTGEAFVAYYSEEQMEADKALAKDYLENIAGQLKQKGVTVETQVKFGNAAEEIISLAGEIHADLVIMSTHGRSGIGRWVFGSVAEKVLYEGYTPLMLVRARTAKA
jgi:nucleotide-binding universal stress UspA family protein